LRCCAGYLRRRRRRAFLPPGLLRLDPAGKRTNATEQAAAVADNILVASRTYTPLPYFWTDQYDTRIQVQGTAPGGAELVVVDGDVSSRRFVGQWRHRGQTTGIRGWNMAKQTR
jgi:NADPH-dependent 2,4-dienoyl-CoA reductase/sulfur reductase-like enzyme